MDAASEANLYRVYEKQRQDATRQRPVLPVTIITGFLGAGKTTLLRKILRSKHNLRIAAVVNEYGSVDHDGGVVERDGFTDSVEKLAGGCVCCQGSLGDELEDKVGELLGKPDHAEDRYDYLVIETSGVSDPESIVRALDKSFGKLTRARLDSVVTVVDADALLHQLEGVGQGGGGMMVSLKRQLESADVIILNKADLLDQQGLSKLSAEVLAVNPSARVESCSYGQVPLHAVLDVEVPRTDIQGVSHERVKTHLRVSSKGGNLRTASSSTKNGQRKVSNGHEGGTKGDGGSNGGVPGEGSGKVSHGHLRDDGLEQVTFASSVPLSLARFQDWVCYGMPVGVVRVKGILAFDEDRLTRSVFNMSGRRRLAFESDGEWEGPMSLYLVVIGVGMDRAKVLADLEGLRVVASAFGRAGEVVTTAQPRQPSDAHGGEEKKEETDEEEEGGEEGGDVSCMLALLAEDPLFDAVPKKSEPACPANVVRFRFTGAGAYGIPPSQLCLKFGVDLDAVNRAVLRSVNNGAASIAGSRQQQSLAEKAPPASGGNGDGAVPDPDSGPVSGINASSRVFLTCQEGVHVSGNEARGGVEEECVVLRYAVGGKVSLVKEWPMVVRRAREVMKTELGHVHFCSCFS